MKTKTTSILFAAGLFLFITTGAIPQDVLMNSAETINPGNLKIAVFPTVLFGQRGGNATWGTAARLGIGISKRFDIEAKGAIFQGFKYYGFDIEYWLLRGHSLNGSISLGYHWTDHELGEDSSGLDGALIVSTIPGSRLEMYGGAKFARDTIKNTNVQYTLVHLVPGLEYKVTRTLDFLLEFGFGITDNSRDYASIGLAFYLFR